MNWLIGHLIKEARGRRFRSEDKVRYFTEGRKGKGKGVVLTPTFSRGTVVDFDPTKRQYQIRGDGDDVIDVHPRNIIPDGITSRSTPEITVAPAEEVAMIDPFLR